MTATEITALLRKHSYPVATEERLQFEIAAVLTRDGIPFEREYRLDPQNRIDFFCDGVGIEVKTRHPRRKTYMQMRRYTANKKIKSLILITGTFMGLPEEINGKPVYMVSLGRTAL